MVLFGSDVKTDLLFRVNRTEVLDYQSNQRCLGIAKMEF